MNNKTWVLRKRPQKKLAEGDIELVEGEYPNSALEPGEVRVKNLMFSVAPTMRNWLNAPERSYRASVEIGGSLRSPAAFEILESNHPDWQPGQRVRFISSWSEYAILNLSNPPTPVVPLANSTPLEHAMGLCGLNSMTAYLGLTRIGQPKAGETLLVSGAAGSVGSMVVQIGRELGCHVIGIAGGPDKCQRVVEQYGAAACIDYKNQSLAEQLATLCPNGINVFFDNVGGDALQAAIDHAASGARMAICGQISAYDSDTPAAGPADMMRVVYWSITIRGFLLGDFSNDDFIEAQQTLERWHSEGKVVHHTDVRQGIEALDRALLDIFSGDNTGSLLVDISHD